MLRSATAALQPRVVRIAWLLCAVVLFFFLAFCFFASSVCITVLLAAFLSILVDPLVVRLQRWHIPRAAAAAIVVAAGMMVFCFISYEAYNRFSILVEHMPQYADKIRELITPINQKIAKVKETAATLAPEAPSKKVTEVKIKEPSAWPAFIMRGVAPAWGAIIIIGVVPFLAFFNLIRKDQMEQRLASALGSTIDVPKFLRRLTAMIRGFAIGNLLIGSAMAAVTVVMLLVLKIQGALILGIVSGFSNLIPFLGIVVAAGAPLAAALLQFNTAAPFAAILLMVVILHVIAQNYLVPKIIGSRVNIGPVAATCGVLFWGWLWGVIGILLAIPLTAFVKIVADTHPALIHISNLLAETPRPVRHAANTGA